MKEHPIIFSGPMVRAILEGRKTMTRRVIKGNHKALDILPNGGIPAEIIMEKMYHCPYGQPGDRLWVRETCVRFTGCAFQGKPWSQVPFILSPDGNPYKALLPIIGNEKHVSELNFSAACVTIPSIFMPRWASRLLLEITAIRVDRVQMSWDVNPWVWVMEFRRVSQ